MVFSYLWEIFQGVHYRGHVIVAHAWLWIQGSTQTQCATSRIFVHTQARAHRNTCGLLLIEAIWQRIIFFHLDLPLLIFMKTMTHCLSADGHLWIAPLFLSLLLSLSILLCLIHGNYGLECAHVRLLDCCIFHRRLELTAKCLISSGFISIIHTCRRISYLSKKACWGMLRRHVSNLCHHICLEGILVAVTQQDLLFLLLLRFVLWQNETGGMRKVTVCSHV